MRKILLLILIIAISCHKPGTNKEDDYKVTKLLDSLIQSQDYFKLRKTTVGDKRWCAN